MPNSPNNAARRIKKGLFIALIVLLCLAVAAGGTFAVLYFTGRSALFDRDDTIIQPPESLTGEVEEGGDTVTYEGKTYRFNDDVIGILVMGVDKEAIKEDTSSGTNGQADTLLLAAVNTVTGAVNIIPISRETMVEVDLYSESGALIGSEKMQLCLAYAYYADDKLGSCENVCRSVSRLLYGAPVDSYIAIDMEGVEVATDMLGGVPVTVLEDIAYKRKDVYLSKGQKVTLSGRQAIGYIRYRQYDTTANARRMARQKQFFNAFVSTATAGLKKDFTKLGSYYATIQPYVVSDLDLSKITYLASTCLINRKQSAIEFLSIEGKHVDGPEHTEFYPDSDSVYKAVLTAFYEEVK